MALAGVCNHLEAVTPPQASSHQSPAHNTSRPSKAWEAHCMPQPHNPRNLHSKPTQLNTWLLHIHIPHSFISYIFSLSTTRHMIACVWVNILSKVQESSVGCIRINASCWHLMCVQSQSRQGWNKHRCASLERKIQSTEKSQSEFTFLSLPRKKERKNQPRKRSRSQFTLFFFLSLSLLSFLS